MRRIALLVLTLLSAGPAAAQSVEEKQRELARIRSQIADITRDVKANQTQRDTAMQALAEAEQRVGAAASGVRAAEQSIDETQAHLVTLEGQRVEIETDLGRERAALAEQVRAAYRYGRQERVKLLLMQDDPAAVGRVLGYYDALNRARAERIRRVEAQAAALDEVEAQIGQEQERQLAYRATRESELAELQAARVARQRALTAIDQRLRSDGERLSNLQSDAQELHRLIAALQETLRRAAEPDPVKPFPEMKGRLPWPLGGSVRAGFGDPRQRGGPRWQGLLIEAPEGRQVKAIHPGQVVFADWLRGYGLMVIVDHGDDYLSIYAHNQSVFPEPGDTVERGEVVATAGNSGGLDHDGLYFEIRKDGRPVNPAGWLARR